jgi:hypothetical protein
VPEDFGRRWGTWFGRWSSGLWRNGSLGRRAALVLVLFWAEITVILSASVYVYLWGMCGWAQIIGSIGEAGGGFLFVFVFVWGAVRRRGVVGMRQDQCV